MSFCHYLSEIPRFILQAAAGFSCSFLPTLIRFPVNFCHKTLVHFFTCAPTALPAASRRILWSLPLLLAINLSEIQKKQRLRWGQHGACAKDEQSKPSAKEMQANNEDGLGAKAFVSSGDTCDDERNRPTLSFSFSPRQSKTRGIAFLLPLFFYEKKKNTPIEKMKVRLEKGLFYIYYKLH